MHATGEEQFGRSFKLKQISLAWLPVITADLWLHRWGRRPKEER